MTRLAEGIVGMNLNRQVLTGIDELDEEGEVVAETFYVALPKEIGTVFFYDLRQSHTTVLAAEYDGFRTFDSGNDPRFRSPQGGLENRIEF